jgi:hypothetical protein
MYIKIALIIFKYKIYREFYVKISLILLWILQFTFHFLEPFAYHIPSFKFPSIQSSTGNDGVHFTAVLGKQI